MSSCKRLLVYSWESTSYSRMKASTVLLLVTLCTGAARALEGGCGRPGALRCDADGRHVSACTKGGAWRRVLDCGASRGACVDGRCVGAARASARAEQCSSPGEWGCSSDCVYRTICTSNHVWAEVSPCPAGYICDCGECVGSATKTCRYSDVPICGQGSKGEFFPDIDNCTRAYACLEEGEPAVPGEVCTVKPDIYFQPCAQVCVSTSLICDRYQSCNGNEGLDAVIPGNPSLHYICANGTMFLMKCAHPNEIYSPLDGKCVDAGVVYCPKNKKDISTFSKIVRFDDCSSTDSSTTTTDGTPTPSRPCIVGDKWADLHDECKFYYCYPPGEPIHMTCPPNSKYDATGESCVSASGLCLR